MASKILITLPTATNFQSPMQTKDFATCAAVASGKIGRENRHSIVNTNNIINMNDAVFKISELEKTVQFLIDEQKTMLTSLHDEIVTLQEKNRDLIYRLICKRNLDSESEHILDDADIEITPTSGDTLNDNANEYRASGHNTQIHELEQTADLQEREIVHLKNQLELLSMKNKAQNHESRRVDNYVRDIEERNKDQEKLIRFLRKENKDYKSEIENLRKTLNNVCIGNHTQQNIQMNRVQPHQSQFFPPVGTSPPFWCQNRAMTINDYQLHRNSICGGDRVLASITGVSYNLPSASNYRQVAVTAPPQFYKNGNFYYSAAQRPMLRNNTHLNDNAVRCSLNKNAH